MTLYELGVFLLGGLGIVCIVGIFWLMCSEKSY